jgi:hypothetical protein
MKKNKKKKLFIKIEEQLYLIDWISFKDGRIIKKLDWKLINNYIKWTWEEE